LTPWDQSFLKALYHTEQTDKMQLSEIKISIVRDVASGAQSSSDRSAPGAK
jgi:hypothetical protein